jgi:hypothetical protein
MDDLPRLRAQLDPFTVAQAIERKLAHIYRLTSRAQPPRMSRAEHEAIQDVSGRLGIPIIVGAAPARLKRRLTSVRS